MLKHLLVAVIALTWAANSSGNVVGNGPPNQSGGSDLNGFLLADQFTLSTASIVNSITYWALQSSSGDYSGSTLVDIFSDNGTGPGAVIFSQLITFTATATANTFEGLTEYQYTATVAGPSLGSGDFWIGLHNGPLNTVPGGSYYWAWHSDAGNSMYQDLSLNSPSWTGNDAALAFELTTTPAPVPVPASILLMGSGLVAAFSTRRRRASEV